MYRNSVLILRCGKKISCGQTSLEYLLLLSAFLISIVTLLALWKLWSSGDVLSNALRVSSHLLDAGLAGALKDVLLY